MIIKHVFIFCTRSLVIRPSLYDSLFMADKGKWLDKILTCLLNTATSSLNESEEQTSPPATPGSRGVHVANSHFSKINANNGKSGCLQK